MNLNTLETNELEILIHNLDEYLIESISKAIKVSGLNHTINKFPDRKDLKAYNDATNIPEYIFLKLKEYYISETLDNVVSLLIKDISLADIKNLSNFNVETTINYYSIKYDILFNKESSFNKNLQDFNLSSLRDDLNIHFKSLWNSIDTEKINSTSKKAQTNSFANLYHEISTEYDENYFFLNYTPFKYIIQDKLHLEEQNTYPFYYETLSVMLLDCLYQNSNFIKKSETLLSSLRTDNSIKRNSIPAIINDYNSNIDICNNIMQNYLKFDVLRANLQRHYFNKIYSNDFFKSVNSNYISYLCTQIKIKELYKYSQQCLHNKNKATHITPSDLYYSKMIESIKVLSFLKKYNINLDEYLNFEISDNNVNIVNYIIRLDKLNTFLYVLSETIEQFQLPPLDKYCKLDLHSAAKHLSNYLNELDERHSKLEHILDENSNMKSNYFLFSYLILEKLKLIK